MPIRRVEETKSAPIRGRIRLGVRQEVRKGVSRPVNVDHFVLTDAPDVIDVYGQEPDEIDIILPSDDIEDIIPTWLKLYAGGTRREDGSTAPGRLLCRGDGPGTDGSPGQAIHYAAKDPVTGVIPTRECWGENCPDYKDAKGRQVCYQNMQVICFIPRVSMGGVYLVNTRSWHSIRSFTNMVHWISRIRNGKLKGVPAKIVRRKREIQAPDGKGGSYSRTHYIMELEENPDFYEKYGGDLEGIVKRTFTGNLLLPDREEVVSLPAPSAFVLTEESQQEQVEAKIQTAEELLEDVEVKGAFDWLQETIKVEYSQKNRKIFIRKLEATVPPEELRVAVLRRIKEVAEERRPQEGPNNSQPGHTQPAEQTSPGQPDPTEGNGAQAAGKEGGVF